MTTQNQQLADTGYQISPSDVPRPFTNQVNINTRIPEELVNSKTARSDWRLNTIGNRPITVTGGFNEIHKDHSPKSGVLYMDDQHDNPNKPGVKSGNLNIGIDYVVGGDEAVTPWYGGKIVSVRNVQKSDTHSYGNQVVIKTNQSYEDKDGKRYPLYNAYSHLKYIEPGIKNGTTKEVNTGDFIGKMGNSGLPKDFGKHVDFQSYIIVNNQKIHVSPNLMQSNLEKQQQAGKFRYSQENTSSSTAIASNTDTQKYQQISEEAVQSSSRVNSSDLQKSNTNVSKVVALLRENADAVKQQYGLDVNTSEGLGKAVMQYWKENSLDPQILKEQLPGIKDSDFEAVLKSLKNTNATQTAKNDQRSM